MPQWLERRGSRRVAEGLARYGIQTRLRVFGVSMGTLLPLGKQLGGDHALAGALWQCGVYAARLLATIVGELRKVQAMKDELVDLRLRREINADTFRTKQQQLVARERELQQALGDAADIQTESGEQAVRAFELSQELPARWLGADIATNRLLLDIVCLNVRLDGQTLVPALRKPSDLLAAGLLGPSAGVGRGERI